MTRGISCRIPWRRWAGGLKESDSLGGGAGLLTLLYNTGLPETMIDYVFDVVGRINEIVMLSGVQTVIFLAALQSIPRQRV